MAQNLASNWIALGVASFAVGVASQHKGAYQGKSIRVSEPDPRVKATLQLVQSGFPHAKANTALGVALNENIQALHASFKCLSLAEARNCPRASPTLLGRRSTAIRRIDVRQPERSRCWPTGIGSWRHHGEADLT